MFSNITENERACDLKLRWILDDKYKVFQTIGDGRHAK